MKDIYDQYAALSRDYSNLLDDYQDIREDTRLLDWVEKNNASIHCAGGWYERLTKAAEDPENEKWVWLPWCVSAHGTMGPPSATVRDAIEGFREALGEIQ